MARRPVRSEILSVSQQDTLREQIRASRIIDCLVGHVAGEVKMRPSQVTAALGLLRKTLPDLASVEHSGEVTHNYVAELPPVSTSTEEWLKQLSSGDPTASPRLDS